VINRKDRSDVSELLKRLGFHFLLDKLDMPPDVLSGGQQQILNVLGAIWACPDFILADEPTSKLDEVNRIRVANLLLAASRESQARILLATHDHNLADALSDRIVTLKEGCVDGERPANRPGGDKCMGAVRLVRSLRDLPSEFQGFSEDWWQQRGGCFFGDDYYCGDDSTQGYLARQPLTREERTRREVDGVLRLAGLRGKTPAIIADIPCGWCRHSIEFAKRGLIVRGIDLCGDYLQRGKEAAERENIKGLQLFCTDMRKLPLETGSCDAVANLWTSFGFFGKGGQDGRLGDVEALREFARVLRPGGKIIIHMDLNPDRVCTGIFDEPSRRSLRQGGYLNVEEYYCEEDSAIYGRWCVTNQDGIAGSVHIYKITIYSLHEWHQLVASAGLAIDGVFGGLDEHDAPFSERSQECVLVLSKERK
jgi:energy-coupling factor transporter ATP-binding protein EcfA2